MNDLFFKEMRKIRKEIDEAFEKFLEAPKMLSKLYPGKEVELFHQPLADVVEKANEVIVKAEMPGLSKDNIKIDIKNGMLEIRGERHAEKKEAGKDYFRQERSYNGFYRTLPLPTAVKVENVNSKYENGILTVTLPKMHHGLKRLGHKIR